MVAQLVNKRSVINLYSVPLDLYSHQIRIILCIKGINAEIIETQPSNFPKELLQFNPYGILPMLVDRNLVLYEHNIIAEYLDERFPHPSLLPVFPIARAKFRQIIRRIEQDLYVLVENIKKDQKKEAKNFRKKLIDSLVNLAPLFAENTYFLSDELTLVDCCLAPLLWCLPSLEIELPSTANVIKTYSESLFKRPFFKASLTERDLELYSLE